MWRKAVVQALGVEQHLYGVEADAAAISVLLLVARAAIKRIKNMLKLLFGEWFAGVLDSQLILATSNFYHAAGVAMAYRV